MQYGNPGDREINFVSVGRDDPGAPFATSANQQRAEVVALYKWGCFSSKLISLPGGKLLPGLRKSV